MRSQIHFIEVPVTGVLAIMPKPPGNEQLAGAMKSIREAGIGVLVSLIESQETTVLGLEEESHLFVQTGGEFISHPIPDRQIPGDTAKFTALAASLAKRLSDGEGVGAHCWGGIGRSGMLVCAIQCELGVDVKTARANASKARGISVPETEGQIAWLHNHYG